jgi:hypothetical protein
MSNAWALKPLNGTMSASSTAAGFDPSYVLNDHAGVVWQSAAGASTRTLTIDLGAGYAALAIPDAALFFGCTGATTAWTLTVEAANSADFATAYWTDGAAVQFLAGATMPSHGRGAGLWIAATTPPARRYWRFTFGSLSSAAVTVGRLMLGTRLTLERNFGFGGVFGVRDLGKLDFSAFANLLRRRGAKLRTMSITFSNAKKDEVVAKIQPLVELLAGQEAFAIVTDPAAATDRQLRCWGGWMVGEMGTIQRASHAWVWKVNFVDLVPIPKAA